MIFKNHEKPIKTNQFLIKILITTVNAFVLQYIVPGIKFRSIFTALFVAIILALLDALIKPLLVILTLPVTIITLGLFLFAINAFIVLIAEYIVPGFEVQSFWHAFLFSLLLSLFNSFVHKRAFPKEKAARP
ncbi:MAG: phage holin family protein [Bacteroidota bacterium]|nr:phage holin family protein [Ferruginibacter sp.]